MTVIPAIPNTLIFPYNVPAESGFPYAESIGVERLGFANIQPVGPAYRCEMVVVFVTSAGNVLEVKGQFLADLADAIIDPQAHPVVTGVENMIFVFRPIDRPDLVNIWWGKDQGRLDGQLAFKAYDLLLQAAPLRIFEYVKKNSFTD